jgi:dTDP-glucose 4,6-dehydratase
MILTTGAAGFIGSNFVRRWLSSRREPVVNLDRLTYAGNPANLADFHDDARYRFIRGEIGDRALVGDLLARHRPRAVIHFAAESHVDRSIRGPAAFIETNVVGTFQLLEAVREYWHALPDAEREGFRFLHISTDEVYGSLAPDAPAVDESHAYAPNSPYAASKAASDHLVRAWHHTYQLPVLTTNCSNNYGPYQFPEKLIPLVILRALEGQPLPIYGDGQQVRDWLHVADHCRGLMRVLDAGTPGEVYHFGGGNELSNLDVVHRICRILDGLRPRADGRAHETAITLVPDRPGHDRRYAIDAQKVARSLGWQPEETFDSGLEQTVRWYLENPSWVRSVQSGEYRTWIAEHYGESTA